jgi:hypothetical protein
MLNTVYITAGAIMRNVLSHHTVVHGMQHQALQLLMLQCQAFRAVQCFLRTWHCSLLVAPCCVVLVPKSHLMQGSLLPPML